MPREPVDGDRRDFLDQLLDKWSLTVLGELCERPLRFNELKRTIGTVTQKSLSQTLRRLERNGIVDRVVVSTRPVAVEYRVTDLGRSLEPAVALLHDWTGVHLDEVTRARDRFDGGVPEKALKD